MIRRQIAGLIADIAPPEKSKFRAPLILIHGLWSGSWCWHEWATHFSNLGWECWSINFRGRAEKQNSKILRQLTLQDCLEDLKRVIAAAPFPPVLMSHDLGGLIAQKIAEEERISALVLAATLPPRGIQDVLPQPVRRLYLKYWPLILLNQPFRPQEKDLRRIWLSSVPENQHREILGSLVPDSSHLIREFFCRHVDVDFNTIRCPVLVIAGNEDKVVPVPSLREMAQRLGAGFEEYSEHGHWIIGEEGGMEIVRDVHRWLIRKLGEEILLAEFREDDVGSV